MRRLVASALLVVIAACSAAEETTPVATPGFAASKTRIPLGSPVDLTYSFDVAADARIERDHRVLVHFLDDGGQPLWTDDHDPPVPTSKWKPGEKVRYTRTVFVPIVPYRGATTVTMGLYSGSRLQDRLPLTGDGRGREYTVGTLDIRPQSESIQVVFRDGWNNVEGTEAAPGREWQWMKKIGTLAFRNPKRDVTLYLETDGRPDLFPGDPQVVTVFVNGVRTHQFTVDHKDPVLRRLAISSVQLGTSEAGEIKLESDKAFVPAQRPGLGGDPRELSIRVYHAFIEPAS